MFENESFEWILITVHKWSVTELMLLINQYNGNLNLV